MEDPKERRCSVTSSYYEDQIKELSSRIDLIEKKIRSKLDYLLKEIQKLRDSKN